MLSKCLRPAQAAAANLAMKRTFGTNPGILHRIFNTMDTSTMAYQVARADPTQPLKVSCRLTFRYRVTSPSKPRTFPKSTT